MADLYTFTLPWPPSVNNLYATVNGHRVLSRRGREFKKTAGEWAMTQGVREPIAGEVGVILDFYPPDRRRRDGDNLCKAVLDAVAKLAFGDDSLVYRLEWEKFKPTATNPRVEVSVYARSFAAVAVCRARNLEDAKGGELVDAIAEIERW